MPCNLVRPQGSEGRFELCRAAVIMILCAFRVYTCVGMGNPLSAVQSLFLLVCSSVLLPVTLSPWSQRQKPGSPLHSSNGRKETF